MYAENIWKNPASGELGMDNPPFRRNLAENKEDHPFILGDPKKFRLRRLILPLEITRNRF